MALRTCTLANEPTYEPTVYDWKVLVDAERILLRMQELALADRLAEILIHMEKELGI